MPARTDYKPPASGRAGPDIAEAEAAADEMARAFEAASGRISGALSDAFSDALTKGETDMRKLIATLVAELARLSVSGAFSAAQGRQAQTLNVTLGIPEADDGRGEGGNALAARHHIASRILQGLNGSGARL